MIVSDQTLRFYVWEGPILSSGSAPVYIAAPSGVYVFALDTNIDRSDILFRSCKFKTEQDLQKRAGFHRVPDRQAVEAYLRKHAEYQPDHSPHYTYGWLDVVKAVSDRHLQRLQELPGDCC